MRRASSRFTASVVAPQAATIAESSSDKCAHASRESGKQLTERPEHCARARVRCRVEPPLDFHLHQPQEVFREGQNQKERDEDHAPDELRAA